MSLDLTLTRNGGIIMYDLNQKDLAIIMEVILSVHKQLTEVNGDDGGRLFQERRFVKIFGLNDECSTNIEFIRVIRKKQEVIILISHDSHSEDWTQNWYVFEREESGEWSCK
jgi:hypothetical protein